MLALAYRLQISAHAVWIRGVLEMLGAARRPLTSIVAAICAFSRYFRMLSGQKLTAE